MLLIGAERGQAWEIVRRCALSCLPAIRRRALEALHERSDWTRTTAIGAAIGHPTNTAHRALEDLYVHKLVQRRAAGGGEGGRGHPDEWAIAEWVSAVLDSQLPGSNQMYLLARRENLKAPGVEEGAPTGVCTSGYFPAATGDAEPGAHAQRASTCQCGRPSVDGRPCFKCQAVPA
jgi:hypothetical protein